MAVLTFLVVLVWVVVSAVGRSRQNTIPADVAQLAQPLDPKIDTGLILKLQERAK